MSARQDDRQGASTAVGILKISNHPHVSDDDEKRKKEA
jgi:hypothetical protein